jgi:hypothetical protein
VRIDGLYFDQQAALSNRVVEGSTIHIFVNLIEVKRENWSLGLGNAQFAP